MLLHPLDFLQTELGLDDLHITQRVDVAFDVDDLGVATVRLHRPERGNSWTGRMHAEYRWIMAELEADPRVRVAVLTGSGRAFCEA